MTTSNLSAFNRFLERLLSRSTLSPEDQAAIRELPNQASQVAANHDVVIPGKPVDHACLVVDGLVARFDQLRDGSRELTAIYIPGDMCDLHSVVAPTPNWGLVALTTTTALHVPHRNLIELATSRPPIAMAFWRDTVVDASVLGKWVSTLGRRAALARLAHLFCELGLRYEEAGVGTRTRYPLAATQAHLADLIGLTPIHVNRTMMALREMGLIESDRRMMRINDWDRLAELAEFDAEYLLIEEPRKRAAEAVELRSF